MKIIFCGILPNSSKKVYEKTVFAKFAKELCKKYEKRQKIQKMRKLVKNAIMHAKMQSHFSKVSTHDHCLHCTCVMLEVKGVVSKGSYTNFPSVGLFRNNILSKSIVS